MTLQPNLFDNIPKHQEPEIWEQPIEAILLQKDVPETSLLDLIPEKGIVRFIHNYAIQPIHISKILNTLDQKETEGLKVSQDILSKELSITSQRTQATFLIMSRIGLITNKSKLTPFGKIVLEKCPYIDDPNLLLLFHYSLASNANLIIWSHLFNKLFYQQKEWEKQNIVEEYLLLSGRMTGKFIRKILQEEVKGILLSYTESFLNKIEMIIWEDNEIICESNTTIIPPLIWLSTIMLYKDRYYPNTPSLETPLIIDANFSPGRILRQNQPAVWRALDELHNVGLLTVETRSGLDQVRFKRGTTWLSAAAQYLKGEAP